jgi:drug/metabolite transporter (DMT)-like permease
MNTRAWVLFAAVAVLWGAPYLLIKVAVDDGIPPGFVAWARVVMGAAILLGLAGQAGLLHTLRGRWKWMAVFAFVEVTLPFPLIATAEQHVSSSLTAILIATAPLFVALLAPLLDPSERVGGRRLAGLLVGLMGVIALAGLDVAQRRNEWWGVAAIVASSLCYAIGPIVYKKHLADLDERVSMGGALLLGIAFLAPVAALDPPRAWPSPLALAALAALGVFCTAAAFVCWGALITAMGAGRALIVTYVNPLVAVALGMALLGERPGAGAFVGLVLILAGSWLAGGKN